jgi:polysaccharide export outer membrane protein
VITVALLLAVLQAAPAPAPGAHAAPPAQPPATSTQAGGTAPAAPTPRPSADYQVGPGDVLEVLVYGNEDLSRIPTVQTNGAIVMPLLGDVQVAGLTIAEVQRKITTLLAKDYLVNPQVEVKVKEYQSQFVSVVGEVNAPGRQPLRGRTRLIDALIEAKGFTPRASGEVMITRSDGTFDGGRNTITVRISSSASPSAQDTINLELPLKSGDIVTASPKFYVTVDGEVNRPGRYAIEADLTVTGVVSLAGGLTRFGSSTVKVRRNDPQTGKVSVIEVDLKDVRNGKKPDLPLLPNDVISVKRRIL